MTLGEAANLLLGCAVLERQRMTSMALPRCAARQAAGDAGGAIQRCQLFTPEGLLGRRILAFEPVDVVAELTARCRQAITVVESQHLGEQQAVAPAVQQQMVQGPDQHEVAGAALDQR